MRYSHLPGRSLLVVAAVVAGIAVVDLWAYARFQSARTHALLAQDQLQQATELEVAITQLKRRPTVVGESELAHSELSARIEAAARSAGVAATSLVSIMPRPAERVGETPFQRKPTQISLRLVTLAQASAMLHALSNGPAALDVDALRVTVPHDDPTSKLWQVEATVTYLVYAPKDKPLDSGGEG